MVKASDCEREPSLLEERFGTLTNLLRSPRPKHVAASKEEGSFPYLAFIRRGKQYLDKPAWIEGGRIMKAVRKFLFAISVVIALTFTASANVQWQGQEKKPEKVKEQPKPDKNKEERRDNERNDRKDEKKNNERKRP
ncbi:MAG: hypothetical protein JST85_09070 [Acidobacteria bacterium]|nr:hypothetical protein [Acidobacteriota bacterium]